MGLVKKLRSAGVRSVHRRKKESAGTVRAVAPPKGKKRAFNWDFRATSNLKSKRVKDEPEVPQKAFSTPVKNDAEAEEGYASITDFFGWGWLTSCFGLYIGGDAEASDTTSDDTTDESSGTDDDDGSEDSSQPSESMLNRVLKLPKKPDDVSEITSAASISIDDSESESTVGT